MSELKSLTYDETEAILISDDDNIGTLIGISKSGTKIWKCAVYIGTYRFIDNSIKNLHDLIFYFY